MNSCPIRQRASKGYYFSTRDLALIAVVSAAGGVLSTYVGYLGNLMNRALGVPFGAGQWMAGLHVFWFVLVRVLVGRTGAGALAGILKGVVEMFSGSTHGLPIVLISAIQGLLIDVVLLPFPTPTLPLLCLAGGIASASNVIVFQILYFSGVSWGYIALITLFAFLSGMIFGGYFARGILDIVEGAHLLRIRGKQKRQGRSRLHLALTLLMALTLAGGAVYYYTSVFQPFWTGPTCQIAGNVTEPLEFRPIDFERDAITVTAELKGQVTYIPPADYTGVPLSLILERAGPKPGAKKVFITATDGYEAEFDLDDIMGNQDVLLAQDGDTLRIVAPDHEGAYWVRMVSKILVE